MAMYSNDQESLNDCLALNNPSNRNKSSGASSKNSMGFSIVNQLKLWSQKSRQRKRLKSLEERMLVDIGYTHAQAKKESNEPFWK